MLYLLQRLRRHGTLTACMGILAICMQLAASGISTHHWLQAQVPSSVLGSICSSSSTDSSAPLGSGLMQLHCAACVVASQAPITPAIHLPAFEPSLVLPSVSRPSVEPTARAPDVRHAPPRAPPFFV